MNVDPVTDFGNLLLLVPQELQERLGSGRQELLAAVDDADGTDKLGHVGGDRAEDSGFHFPDHARFGKNAHPGLERDCVLDRFDIVEFHGDIHIHAALAQRLVDRLPDAEVSIESSERLSFQIPVRNRFSLRERMAAMAHKHHGFEMPGHDRQRSMRRGRRKNPEIGLVVDYSLDHFVWMQIRKTDLC